MPILGRLLFCSALAVTVGYAFYRKRSKLSQEHCNQSDSISVEYSSESFHRLVRFSSECIEVLKPEDIVEYRTPVISGFAKVTFCSTICISEANCSELKSGESIEVCVIDPELGVSESCSTSTNTMKSLRSKPCVEVAVETGFSGSVSDPSLTPDSNESSSPEGLPKVNIPLGCFNDPTNDIYEDNPEELNGTMLPKVLIPSEMWAEAMDKDIWHETFCVPAHMGGVLIGRLGKNVKELRSIWDADFCLNTCPGRQDTLIFKLSCPIKHKNDVLQWIYRRLRMRPSRTPIGNPNQLKRYLPLGEAVPVYVRSLYASKELFVTIQDSEYLKYLKMQAGLDADYAVINGFRTQLCEPVTSGTVAVVPHSHGFARALIISVYSTWPKTVFYFLLDHGTFGVVPLEKLRKIRAKYMRTPFQAIHVSWAHAFPVFSDIPDIHILRTFFTNNQIHAFAVRMDTCCRTSVAFAEPYPEPYSANGLLDVLVTACNSGLYMTVPLVLHPSRQCWLNATSIPYYPFTYSAVDYPALVHIVPEEAPSSNENPDSIEQPNNVQYKRHDCGIQRYPNDQNVTNRGRISRGGGAQLRRPFIRYQRNSHAPSISQKENEHFATEANKIDSKPRITQSDLNDQLSSVEPRRKPLSVRNSRGSAYRGRFTQRSTR